MTLTIHSTVSIVEPSPDQIGHPTHEADITEVVLTALLNPERRGRFHTSAAQDDAHTTLPQVTGRPARTYAQWARDHAADLLGP